jgi:hypothetical protein
MKSWKVQSKMLSPKKNDVFYVKFLAEPDVETPEILAYRKGLMDGALFMAFLLGIMGVVLILAIT